MGLHLSSLQEDQVVARGLLNYICYRSHCDLSHAQVHSEGEVLELMQQYAMEAIRDQAMSGLYAHYPRSNSDRDQTAWREVLDNVDELV